MLTKKRLSFWQKLNVAYCKWYHGFDPYMDVFVTLPIIPDAPKPMVEVVPEETVVAEAPEEKPVVINATVSTPNRKLSQAMTTGANSHPIFCFHEAKQLLREPKKVWLYNIGPSAQEVHHPEIGTLRIPAHKSGKYTVVTSFPNPITFTKPLLDTDQIDLVPVDGRRFVMDLINPDNLGLDQDEVWNVLKPTSTYPWSVSEGCNLGQKGLFWSLSNPPAEKDIKAAYKRMANWYKGLLEQAYVLSMSDPSYFWSKLTPEYHAAAEYFQITTVWHPVLKP